MIGPPTRRSIRLLGISSLFVHFGIRKGEGGEKVIQEAMSFHAVVENGRRKEDKLFVCSWLNGRVKKILKKRGVKDWIDGIWVYYPACFRLFEFSLYKSLPHESNVSEQDNIHTCQPPQLGLHLQVRLLNLSRCSDIAKEICYKVIMIPNLGCWWNVI